MVAPPALAVYCADVGSVRKGRFGWAGHSVGGGTPPRQGTDITELASAVAADLNAGVPTTLGFGCPLFVPITDDPCGLTAARRGEGARPWCAGAGAGALATGLTEAVWLLRAVVARLEHPVPAFVAWDEFTAYEQGLFVWEAFVTGAAKGTSHAGDAEAAVQQFAAALPDPTAANALESGEVHSLIGAALLRTGWSTDLSLLATPALVIKA